MKRAVILAVVLILVTGQALMSDNDHRWVPGMVLIEVTDPGSGDPTIAKDGFVATGWPEVDNACRELGINRWERIIPIPSNPKSREEWAWTERWFSFHFDPAETDVLTAVERLQSAKGVTHVEPNYLWKACTTTPNDPYYADYQWHLPHVGANRIWDYTTGDSTIILSAIDSGVDYLHEDLTNLIWQNLGEDADGDGQVFIPGVGFDPDDMAPNDTIDDDGNGLVNDLIGYDWVTDAWGDAYRDETHEEDGYTYDNDPADFVFNGHGTHCSGTMLAQTNNNIGVAGVCWQGKIMCLRAGYFDKDLHGYSQNRAVTQAIQYGLEKGCKIFNLSYGGYNTTYVNFDTTGTSMQDQYYFVRTMIDSAVIGHWGAIVVGSAGNDGTDTTYVNPDNPLDTAYYHYPSTFPNVISVANTNEEDCKSYSSNFDSTVDISAPGKSIAATVPWDFEPAPADTELSEPFAQGYAQFSGTSMSGPIVAGCAALLWSFFPDSSNHWIRQRLEETAVNIYTKYCNRSYEATKRLGSGRVDIYRAIGSKVFPQVTLDSVDMNGNGMDGHCNPGEDVEVFLTYSNTEDSFWAAATGASVTLSSNDTLITITDSVGYIGDIPIGGSVVNSTDPIVFHMKPEYKYGHFVKFEATLTTDCGYVHKTDFVAKVGYPEVLVATYDTIYLNKTSLAFDYAGYIFDSLYVPYGLDSTQLSKHRVVLVLSGKADAAGVDFMPSSLEADLEEWLTDPLHTDRLLLISGQDLPEDTDSAWLARLFKAVHVNDSLLMTYGFYVYGTDGDLLGDGIDKFMIAMGGAMNRSFGSCMPIGDGVQSFYYNYGTLPDSSCVVRCEDPTGYKTVMMEFGIEAFPDHIRHTFIERLMEWAGVEKNDVPEKSVPRPVVLELLPPFPNPFNSAVTIGFRLPAASPVTVDVYDLGGRLVREFYLPEALAGPNLLRWDARTEDGELLPAGTYLYRVEACGRNASGKIIFIK